MLRKKFYEEYSEIPYSLKSYEHKSILTRSIHLLRKNFIINYLFKSHSKSDLFLEIGCADGYYVNMADLSGISYNVGIDIANNYLKRAKEDANIKKLNSIYICADAEHLPFRSCTFTISLLSEVLEHCPNPDLVLNEFFRVSKNILILSYPTGESFFWVKFLKKIARVARLKTEEAGHINFLNYKEIYQKISSYNVHALAIVGIGYLSWPIIIFPFINFIFIKSFFNLFKEKIFFFDSRLCKKHPLFSDTVIFWLKLTD